MFNFSSASRAQDGRCANCKEQRQEGILSKASIPITTELLNRAVDDTDPELRSLQKDRVEEYLEKKLAWRVMRVSSLLALSYTSTICYDLSRVSKELMWMLMLTMPHEM